MLSGFVLSLGYGKKIDSGQYTTRGLYLRQLFKVYPMHFTMFVLFIILRCISFNPPSPEQVTTNVLLLQSWFPFRNIHFALNSPSWFLCDILFCYLTFKTLYRFIFKLSTRKLVLLSAVTFIAYPVIALSIADEWSNEILFINPMLRLLDFTIGIITYRIYVQLKSHDVINKISNASTAHILILEALPILMLAVLHTFYLQLPLGLQHAWVYWIIIPLMLLTYVATDQHPGIIGKLLHTKPLVWLGNISFEIYITHMGTIALINILFPSLVMSLRLLIIIPCVALVAYSVQRFVVNPCFEFAQRKSWV